MKKILFFGESVSLAHITRPLVLSKWAQKANWETCLAVNRGAQDFIKKQNEDVNTRPIASIDSECFYKRLNQGKFFYTCNELIDYVKDEIKLIQDWEPDLIVSDFRLTTSISSKICDVPLINLSNYYWSPNQQCQFLLPNKYKIGQFSPKLSKAITRLLKPFIFKYFASPLNAVRQMYGLNKLSDFRENYVDGNHTLYMDHPCLFKEKTIGSNEKFIGPVIWYPNAGNSINTTKKNIYVTLGGSGNAANLQKVLNACLPFGLDIIVSGSHKSITQNSKNYSNHSRVHFVDLINPKKILKNSIATICHGGSGTVYQSLSQEVPVICIPQNQDQYLVANIVEKNQLGHNLANKRLTEKRIKNSLEDVLSNANMIKKVKNFSNKNRLLDTENIWVQFLKDLKDNSIRKGSNELHYKKIRSVTGYPAFPILSTSN